MCTFLLSTLYIETGRRVQMYIIAFARSGNNFIRRCTAAHPLVLIV
jgi:hypothetical protein